MKVLFALFLGLILAPGVSKAQHEHHPAAAPTPAPTIMPMPMPSPAPAATPPPTVAAPPTSNPAPMAAMEEMEPMDHWMTMFHGYAFLTANRQGGPSGDREFESQNHLMANAVRSAWGGKVSLSGIFSLEPATIPPAGSAELFQRGETYHDLLLVDRQHPHDLF